MYILSLNDATELQQIICRATAILAGAGVATEAPVAERHKLYPSKASAKLSKDVLKRKYASDVARHLGRPDFVNYVNF